MYMDFDETYEKNEPWDRIWFKNFPNLVTFCNTESACNIQYVCIK